MKRKKSTKKIKRRSTLNSTKMMFLSIILLFIIFEALYILRSQQATIQANSLQKQVAGESIER